MAKWLDHSGQFFNLDKYCQIIRGDDEEILLVPFPYNGQDGWEMEEERQLAILTFKSRELRDLEMQKIRNILIS